MKNKYNIPIVVDWFETRRKNIIYQREITDIWKTKVFKRYINNRVYSIMIVIFTKYK